MAINMENENQEDKHYRVDGTTGTPLGGFGAGAVKFNAMKGSFAATTQAPADEHDYYNIANSKFQFYSSVGNSLKASDTLTGVCDNGRFDDDAIWPLHNVNFGDINGIQINMTAFSPLDTGNHDFMCLPYAFYEISVENQSFSDATIACAFQWDLVSENIQYINGKGYTGDKWAIFATSSDSNAIITTGNDNIFLHTGVCNNVMKQAQNKVAVKLVLAPSEKKSIKFVLSWYDTTDPDGAYYLNLYHNAAEIANIGLANFDRLKNNAIELVEKMRGSNLPKWFVNQTLNSLVNLSNNSIYKKDGRVAFAEGEWTCFGTMDQMWHARKIIGAICPFFAWRELEYWARTQRMDGQIHHDFTPFEVSELNPKYKLCNWDDTEHPDYRKIDDCVDLNCGLIISVYETYQQTADEEKLLYFWPYVKKAAKRILNQVELYGDKEYPYTFSTSSNSYDAGGNPNAFNSSLSAVAYKIMIILSEKMGETDTSSIYQTAFDTVVKSYRERYLKDNFIAGRISESYFGGQWAAMNLKLGQIWTESETDYVLSQLDDYYHPFYKGLGYTTGTYDEWTPYILAHYGGLLLNTRRQKQYEFMQKDAYNRQYLNRNYVFNQPLDILPAITKTNYAATTISGDKQYISTPAIWRNYYDIIGFHRDKSTNDLWIQPIILEEMNHVMVDATFITPDGYGSISCTESGEYHQNKDIIIKFENSIEVSVIHLTDNFKEDNTERIFDSCTNSITDNITNRATESCSNNITDNRTNSITDNTSSSNTNKLTNYDKNKINVSINNIPCKFTRVGEGYTRELLVEWQGIIDKDGIHIVTSGEPGKAPHDDPKYSDQINDIPQAIPDKNAYEIMEAANFSEQAGVRITTDNNGVTYVTDCNNFDYIKFNHIGFETSGAEYITLTVSSELEGSSIQIVLDSVGGETIATIDIPCTNGTDQWTNVTRPIEKITGTHNVIFRFYGGSENNLLNIASFQFLPTNHFEVINRSKWTATSSYNNNIAHLAFDGLINTRWHTRYQTGGEWYLLDMNEHISFDRLILDSAVKLKDYPRGYELYVSQDGLEFGDAIAIGSGVGPITEINFPMQNARYIKIVQTGQTSTGYWSIYDLNVYNTSLRPSFE